MNPTVDYEMTQADLDAILNACKPTPAMFLSGGTPMGRSQQENANAAWSALGTKMGFDYMTVRPSSKGDRFFTAVPSETGPQREARVAREAEEKKQREIAEHEKAIGEHQAALDRLRERN